jgi:hypothetical protein
METCKTLYRKACAVAINDFLILLDVPGENMTLSDLENRDSEELQEFVTCLSRLYNRTKKGKRKIPLETARKEICSRLTLLRL